MKQTLGSHRALGLHDTRRCRLREVNPSSSETGADVPDSAGWGPETATAGHLAVELDVPAAEEIREPWRHRWGDKFLALAPMLGCSLGTG